MDFCSDEPDRYDFVQAIKAFMGKNRLIHVNQDRTDSFNGSDAANRM